MTPGIQPRRVRMRTIKIEPQPLSYTAKGGKSTDNITRQTLILLNFHAKIELLFRLLIALCGRLIVTIFASAFSLYPLPNLSQRARE